MTGSPSPGASQRIGVGLIGCGHMAQLRHVPALRRLRGARVVAVADVDPEARGRVGEALGVEHRYPSAEELLEHPGVDAVGVIVPASVHAEMVVAALEAGKHVLVEKPLALTLEDCDRMLDASRARPELVTAVAFNLRFHRHVRRARGLVQAGAVGPVDSVCAVTTGCAAGVDVDEYLTGWRGRRERGGGALIEKGAHHYDVFRYVLDGEVEEVATMSRSDQSDDRAAVVIGRMDDGTLVTSILGHAQADSHELTVHGDEAILEVAMHEFDGLRLRPAGTYAGNLGWRARRMAATVAGLPRALWALRAGGDFVDSYAAEWRHFLRCLRGEAEVECTLEDGREAARVALAVLEAARTGEAVRVREVGAPVPA